MKKDWTTRANELVRDFIKLQIENNDYYENIKEIYNKNKSCVYDIFDLWENFECRFSIYRVMDSIEKYIQDKGLDTLQSLFFDDNFEIIDW